MTVGILPAIKPLHVTAICSLKATDDRPTALTDSVLAGKRGGNI